METFRSQFSGDIVTPQHADYDQAISRWAANAVRRAAIVAFVKGPEDVALAIRFARESGLDIAIRGGGHNPSGASSSEGGLVIDLSRYLKGVVVDAEKRLAYVQGGAVWGTVDEAAIKHGLATVGGTVNHTGVAGLTLGGGYGILSGAHGLTMDNVVQVTIVTADGKTLIASDSQNSDLFWGIRGGGSNFGVVTEFVFKLHPQRKTVFAGRLMFTKDKCQEIREYMDRWWPSAQPNELVLVGLSRIPGKSTPIIVITLYYDGSETEGREHFKELIDLGPLIDQAKEIPYEKVNTLNNGMVEPGSCFYFKGMLLSKKPSDDITLEKIERLMELIPHPDFIFMNMHEYYPPGKINSVPEDATPYRRNLPGNAIIAIRWDVDSPEKSRQARDIAHAVADMYVKDEAYGNYYNDVGAGASDKAKLMFKEHYPRLQALKQKYDPDMIFNKWYPISPA